MDWHNTNTWRAWKTGSYTLTQLDHYILPVSYITIASCMHYVFSPILSETYYITGTRDFIWIWPLQPISASHTTTCTCLCESNTNTLRSRLITRAACLSRFPPIRFAFYHVSISGWMRQPYANVWPVAPLYPALYTLSLDTQKSSPRTGCATTIGTAVIQWCWQLHFIPRDLSMGAVKGMGCCGRS